MRVKSTKVYREAIAVLDKYTPDVAWMLHEVKLVEKSYGEYVVASWFHPTQTLELGGRYKELDGLELASTIVHELHHKRQYESGMVYNLATMVHFEYAAFMAQVEFYKRVLDDRKCNPQMQWVTFGQYRPTASWYNWYCEGTLYERVSSVYNNAVQEGIV